MEKSGSMIYMQNDEKPKGKLVPHKTEIIDIEKIFGIPLQKIEKYGEVNGIGFKLKHDEGKAVLVIGDKNILAIKQTKNGTELEKYVPDAVIRGLLQKINLKSEAYFKLGKNTQTDAEEADKFLNQNTSGDWYSTYIFKINKMTGQLLSKNVPKDEYTCPHQYLENIEKNLRDNPKAFFVNMNEGAIADSKSKEWIYTVNAVNCSVILLYDNERKTGAIVHLSADDMDSKNLDKFIKKFNKANGGNTKNTKVYLNFGWAEKDIVVISESLEKNGLIDKVVETNLSYEIIKREPFFFAWTASKERSALDSPPISVGIDGSGSIADAFALNLKTGEIYRIKESDMYNSIKGGKERLYQINRSVGDPPVSIKK